MLTLTSPDEMRALSERWRAEGRAVGLVPTMGALHAGHLSLVGRAREECERVVVSVFVNPAQFGPGEDFEKYPRDHERDRRTLEKAGADAVFSPSTEEMYGEEGSDLSSGQRTSVDVGNLGETFEGAERPGHFRGVATVVSMLFHAALPHRAYFGEKDYQQLKLIQKMVRELLMGVEIVGCPILREPDGLAMSSRNVYLSAPERRAAASLYRALEAGKDLARAGERSAAGLVREMERVLAAEPLVAVRYVAVVDAATLRPLETLGEGQEARAILAATVGGVRLIDNAELCPERQRTPSVSRRRSD